MTTRTVLVQDMLEGGRIHESGFALPEASSNFDSLLLRVARVSSYYQTLSLLRL